MELGRLDFASVCFAVACAPSATEGHRSVNSPPPRRPEMTCDEQVRHVQPPQIGAARERYMWRCLLVHQFDAFVWERQACSADGDCTVVETYCPFSCGVAVATIYSGDVSSEHDRLHAEYSKRADCMYKCNPTVGATCREHRCTAQHVVDDPVPR